MPNADALSSVVSLLSKVSFWVDSIPDPIAVIELDGGVQVAWRNNNQHLRLFCAPVAANSYIYTSRTVNGKTVESKLIRQVGVFTLVDGFQWLQAQ